MANKDKQNHMKNMVTGLVGSVVGLMAMRLYWQKVAPIVNEYVDDEPMANDQLNDISLVGQQHEKGESSTEALGRLAYEKVMGEEPNDKTKEVLSYAAHWLYGLVQGSAYGGLRRKLPGADILGGLLFGTALWLFGDETAVPALGLQAGPTAVSPAQHVNRFGAHLAYGLGTAAAAQLLRRIL
jgi:hypothetical protein